jgi:hypothetical protein
MRDEPSSQPEFVYGLEDAETMHHSSVNDFLADYVDAGWTADDGSIKVAKYQRQKLDAGHVDSCVEDMVDNISEEIGPPDGGFLADDKQAQLNKIVFYFLQEHGHIWACDMISVREYSPSEVLRIFE